MRGGGDRGKGRGERWQLTIMNSYLESNRSKCDDLTNLGDRVYTALKFFCLFVFHSELFYRYESVQSLFMWNFKSFAL